MRELAAALPLVLLSGCSVLFEPGAGRERDGGAADARGPRDATQSDARVADASPGDCPGGVPGLFDNVNKAMTDEDDPAVTPDGLTLFFARAEAPGEPADIYMATRSSRCEPWEAAAPRQGEGDVDENNPTLGPDGTLYYVRTDELGSRLYSLDWDDEEATPVVEDSVKELMAEHCEAPFIIDDLFVVAPNVFYASTVSCEIVDQRALYRHGGTDTVDTWVNKNQPWVSADEGVIYMTDTAAEGIYVFDAAGGAVEPELVEIEAGSAPEDPWVTADGWLYYAARDGALAPRDLYLMPEPEL